MKFDPTKPVQTRDGRSARIICTDRKDFETPIIVLVKNAQGEELLSSRYADGRLLPHATVDDDLVNIPVPVKATYWALLYSTGEAAIYSTREAAEYYKVAIHNGGAKSVLLPITVEHTFENE